MTRLHPRAPHYCFAGEVAYHKMNVLPSASTSHELGADLNAAEGGSLRPGMLSFEKQSLLQLMPDHVLVIDLFSIAPRDCAHGNRHARATVAGACKVVFVRRLEPATVRGRVLPLGSPRPFCIILSRWRSLWQRQLNRPSGGGMVCVQRCAQQKLCRHRALIERQNVMENRIDVVPY